MNEEQKLKIYNGKDKSYQRELKRLEKAKISQKDKKLITDFHNYLFSKGSGSLRVTKLSSQLRRMSPKMDKDFDKATKEDLINLVALYNKDTSLSEATKSDYRRALKQFYRWLEDKDKRLDSEDKEERKEAEKLYKYIEDLSTGYKIKQADPTTIITEEDCKKIVEKGCKNPRDKAFISMLHETGCRIGEFLNIKVGDINMKNDYAEATVDGKTGKRTVFFIKSLPHLLRYLEVHPHKEKQQSYLWLTQSQNRRGDPLRYIGARKLISRCFERAGVDKKHNPHWFRHSRATILAPKIRQVMLCKYMGWEKDTKQVKRYTHLSKKQLEDAVFELNGIKEKEEEEEKPIRCSCGALNQPSERYCFKCKRPLKVETAIKDKETVNNEMDKTVKLMMEIAQNPELMKKFKKFKKKMES